MSNTEISKELFERVALGDEAAFEELYYKSYKQVYAFLLSLTMNAEDAKDLLQETYIKIHSSCHMYRDQGTPIAWMIKISRNLFLMKVRKKSEQMTSCSDHIEKMSVTLGGIEDLETRMWLKQLFRVLNDEERQIIVMHVVTGMKHREIADQMNKPLGTVLSKYNRGLRKLKKSVEKSGKEDLTNE